MRSEIKEVLKDQIQEVNKSKVAVLVGMFMVALDVILVLTSVINIYSLLFTLPLVIVVRKQLFDYRIKHASLIFMRYIIDEEFQKEFDQEHNI